MSKVPRHFRGKHSHGFSLTELLVAMVIGLFLLGGLVALMVNSKKNYEQQDYSARLQENARFAIQFLSYDIRMAGYFGCSNDIINNNTAPIAATDSGDASADSITITYGEPYEPGSEIIIDAANYDPYGAPLTLILNSVPSDWNVGDTLVLADCGGASVGDIATITQASNQVTLDVSGTASGSLGRVYDPNTGGGGDVTVRRVLANAYTIQTGQSGIPVLMRNNQELVEGVENLQLLYQGLTGGNFVNGSSAPADLAAVQLAALVRSVSNENLGDREYGTGVAGVDIGNDDGQYTLLDQDVSGNTGTIRGQRRVFNSTLAIRNRSL